jgi:hypothetical protein
MGLKHSTVCSKVHQSLALPYITTASKILPWLKEYLIVFLLSCNSKAFFPLYNSTNANYMFYTTRQLSLIFLQKVGISGLFERLLAPQELNY